MDINYTSVAVAVLGALFSLIGWLLKNKDAAQAQQIEAQSKQIETLFRKHDQDVQRLSDLELDIARQHYRKEELDVRFDRLEHAVRDSMGTLSAKFDKLSDALMQHIQLEDGRRRGGSPQ